MLLGIDPRVPPRLLDCLMRMGHGDEIVIADANFPSASVAAVEADGKFASAITISSPCPIRIRQSNRRGGMRGSIPKSMISSIKKGPRIPRPLLS